ncbi:hypothetical protein BH23ACI1_BH23ACI1_00770 [soil metagenome]
MPPCAGSRGRRCAAGARERASVLGGDSFTIGSLERLVAYSPFGGRLGPDYDRAPDGTRFLFIRPATDTPSSRVQLLVVQNWFAELRAVSPSRRPAPSGTWWRGDR